jgi:DNA replication and repair protein RecF
LGFHPNLNILIGDNGQGKTNILESIFYAATGKSHRTNYDNELVQWNEKFMKMALLGERVFGKIKIEIVIRSDGKKVLKVNNQMMKKLSELIGNINVVLFSPEDIMLVKGGPSIRRRFLDIEISQTSPFYCHNLSSYLKVLSQRNNLLKALREKKENSDLLDVWDMQLVEFGCNIIKKRIEVLNKLKFLAKDIHSRITNGKEELALYYLATVDPSKAVDRPLEDYYMAKLQENRFSEIKMGATLIGPHRDDIEIKIGDTNVKAFGSQGQQRTCALSMKLAELEFMKMETKEYPVLLLDDVLSELDESRRKFLLEVASRTVQTFVTATDIEDFSDSLVSRSRIFRVNDGQITILQEG